MTETDWDFGESAKETARHRAKPKHSRRTGHERAHHDDIIAALQGLHHRLDTLASINTENILIPSGPQEHYHQIVEEAYAMLGLIETEVDELRAELEYEHTRLDEARDQALAEAPRENEK